MMTQQLRVDVLAAPIAAIDRRALSQAWYSALHLAKSPTPQHRAARTASAIEEWPATESTAKVARSRANASTITTRLVRELRAPGPEPAEDRRALRSSLARKIEAAFLRPANSRAWATLTIGVSNAKVHISMVHTQRGLCLVAVCTPRLRDVVARALAQARYALASRGIALEARVAE